jgi:hypothetical protein
MLSMSCPIEVVVLNCWVTETKDTPKALEDLNNLRKVREAPGQAVDLVDHDHVDQALLDIPKEVPEGRAVHVAAGERGVVIVVGDRDPTLGPLTHDVGMARIPLGVDGVVLPVEPSSVDLRV